MKNKLLTILVFCSLQYISMGQSYIITTIAGNGAAGYTGDGGQATAAELNQPQGVAVDTSGNIYIADFINCRIRKISTNGVISTIAGNGAAGFSGDGSQATAAELKHPARVVTDVTGNLYIADLDNSRIRKVTTLGIINTLAGNGSAGFSGDGGQASAAGLHYPAGLNLDASGNVFIADQWNERIRKVNNSGTINSIAGSSPWGYAGDGGQATLAELNLPQDVAVDASGNIYIADYSNDCIRMVNTSGIISTFAGNDTAGYSGDGGPATAAELWDPSGVAADNSGKIYIADYGNNCIRMINSAGIISTIAGNGISGYSGDGGPATAAELYSPWSIALDNKGNIYIGDFSNNRIRKLTNPSLSVPAISYMADSFKIYPNPNNGVFQIVIASEAQSQSIIEVYNMLGEKVYSQQLNIEHSTFNIDISSQPNGVYFVRLMSDKTTQVIKVVKD